MDKESFGNAFEGPVLLSFAEGVIIWFAFATGLKGWKQHSAYGVGNEYIITCNGTDLPLPDSETQWESDPSFENISSPRGRLP